MNLITINVDEDSVRDEVMDKGYHLNWENALNFHANLGKDKKGFNNIFNVTTAPLVIIIEDGKISHAVGDYALYPHKLLLGELINDYKFIWNNSEELNNLAWYYYNYVDDPAGLQIALECVKRSMELDKNYNNTDTYAALLFKTGENTKALKVAKEAIEIAKANDEDYETTTDLINEIIEEL